MRQRPSVHLSSARHERREPTVSPKTILIVDDHPVVREGIRALLERVGEFTVIAEAASQEEALVALEDVTPDVALIDISLQGSDGLELTKTLRARLPQLPILIVSMHEEAMYAERSLAAGANGYVMKHVMPDTVVDAVQTVLRGDIFVSDQIVQHMVRNFARGSRRQPAERFGVHSLSDRELEVLRHIGAGENTRTIARVLHLSVKTIETHRAHLKEKLGLADSNELLRYAVTWLNEPEKPSDGSGERGAPRATAPAHRTGVPHRDPPGAARTTQERGR